MTRFAEVAETIAWLLSPAASFVDGAAPDPGTVAFDFGLRRSDGGH